MESPFEVLQIDHDADEEEIRVAFRKRAKETHPDQGGSAAAFQRVKAAYEQLTAEEDVTSFEPGESTGGQPGAPGATGGQTGDDAELTEVRVEYLNYTVLDDKGWSLDDDDLFEKASDADLEAGDYGRFLADPDETLLEAAEAQGFTWPFSCRGGACANCAVAVVEGELSMPPNHILPDELTDHGIQLSCVGTPTTEELKIVYNVKHLPEVEDLLLPPGPFKRARADD